MPDFESAPTLTLVTTCHAYVHGTPPCFHPEGRVALTLRLLGGLTEETARAFPMPEPTVAQRIVRANEPSPRSSASRSHVRGRAARPSSVLEVLYLIFNEGYSANRRGRLDAGWAV